MNKLLNFRQTDTQKVYFISDPHFNHNPKWNVPLWKNRGFNSAIEMTDGIIDSINATVDTNDILWMLGDFCLNTNESQFEELLSRINCQNIYSLFGNHNSQVERVYKNAVKEYADKLGIQETIEIYPIKYRNLTFYGNYQEITVDGQYMVLCHYPLYVFNYMKDGSIHLTGHSHGNCPLSQPPNTTSKVLDVGWDLFKKPLSFSEVMDIMKTKNTLKVDHHA